MYVNTIINCGFYHRFNNDAEINQLIKLMKNNPDAQYHFELLHLGRSSEIFNFDIFDVESDEGYYIVSQFRINGKPFILWDKDDGEETPWSAIRSTLYNLLVSLDRYGYNLETP